MLKIADARSSAALTQPPSHAPREHSSAARRADRRYPRHHPRMPDLRLFLRLLLVESLSRQHRRPAPIVLRDLVRFVFTHAWVVDVAFVIVVGNFGVLLF